MARSRWKKQHNGMALRSGLEKKVAEYLDQNKVEYEYETVVLSYEIPTEKHKYKPDFILKNGIIIEAKGNFNAQTRKKMGLVIEQNPDLDIRMLFMRDNKISKSSKTAYSDWCEKRGIKYTVSANGTVPEEWIKAKRRRKPKVEVE